MCLFSSKSAGFSFVVRFHIGDCHKTVISAKMVVFSRLFGSKINAANSFSRLFAKKEPLKNGEFLFRCLFKRISKENSHGKFIKRVCYCCPLVDYATLIGFFV